jgi:hypothetical protein
MVTASCWNLGAWGRMSGSSEREPWHRPLLMWRRYCYRRIKNKSQLESAYRNLAVPARIGFVPALQNDLGEARKIAPAVGVHPAPATEGQRTRRAVEAK